MRRVVTLLVLLLAATEIFACEELHFAGLLHFSSHSTPDTSEGGSGDGCLCCCAHIVVVPPVTPLATLGFVSSAVPFDEVQVPEFRSIAIEHPPRF